MKKIKYRHIPETLHCDIVSIMQAFSEDIYKKKIQNIIFIDRSARPAWILFHEYWKRCYGLKNRPGIFFINPDACCHTEIHEGEELAELLFGIQARVSFTKSISVPRKKKEITDKFAKTYKELCKSKNERLAVFDTCMHSGGTMKKVIDILNQSKFEEVYVYSASGGDQRIFREPLTKLGKGRKTDTCYLFMENFGVEKTASLLCKRKRFGSSRKLFMARRELRRIMKSYLINYNLSESG